MSRSDQIQGAIVDRLHSNSRLVTSDIDVRVQDGRVVLEGTVPNSLARHIATSEAMQVLGVVTVDNQLRVESPSPPAAETAPTDEQLLAHIREILATVPIGCERVQASVQDGVVTLSGEVDTLWAQIRVGSIVADIDGVRGVKNYVEVQPPEPVPDEAIARRIVDLLEMYDSIDLDRIRVDVQDGVVTLSGMVQNDSEKQVVSNAVVNSEGIKDLRNHLRTAVG